MPGTYVWADSPIWQRELTEQAQITQIQDYLYLWAEQMRYVLRNLDESNFNEAGLRKITEPLYISLEKQSEELTNRIAITAEGLTAEIGSLSSQLSLKADASAVQLAIQGVEGQITTLSASVGGLSTRVTNAEGNISTLTQTANGLSTRVTNAEGNITTLTQTVNGLTISASNGQSSSTLTLSAGSTTLSSANIQILGMVTFSNLSTAGQTTINGDNITTGEIWGINFYSVYRGNNRSNGFKLWEPSAEATAGGIRYQYESADGDYGDKLYLYTESFYYNGRTYYPSIKLDSVGRVSIEANDSSHGYIYLFANGDGGDGYTAISLRTGHWSTRIAFQCGDGGIMTVREDGIYWNNTRAYP